MRAKFFLAAAFAAFVFAPAQAKVRRVNNERIRYYEPTRSRGMGITYSTDFSCFDGFAANPALLPYMGKKKSVSGLDLMVGSNLFSPIVKGISDSFSDSIGFLADIFEDGSVNFDLQLGTPFMCGFVDEGFGWQTASSLYASANMSGLNSLQIACGDESVFQFGYGKEALSFSDKHRISFGVGIKAAFDAHMEIERLSDIPKGASFDDFPQVIRFAMGFDLGALYRFSDWLCASLVWRDAATPYAKRNLADGAVKTGIIRQNLVFGAGFFLPVKKMKIDKIISSWNFFIDLCDFTHWFNKFDRNPALNVGAGTEACLFRFLFVRAGIYDLHWHMGAGFRVKMFRISLSAFGRELSTEPNGRSQGGVSLSIRFCN